MNKEIELLNNKLEAQDKIINTQALEIARLKEQLEILLEDNSQLEEIRIKATEYIKERFEINEYGEYYFTHTFSSPNMKELLEILGDKE
jgi:hypothetical protein